MIISKILLAAAFTFICSGMATEDKVSITETDPAVFVGSYSGMFSGSPIVIYLETVQEGKAIGYNIHRNLKRPLNGTYEAISGAAYYKFVLYEPGDNEFDGSFEMHIDTAHFNGSGNWIPKPQSKLSPISFVFAKEK